MKLVYSNLLFSYKFVNSLFLITVVSGQDSGTRGRRLVDN